MEPIIKTENLKVIYNKGKDNEFIALNDISIEVFPEEYSIFFGPSGCGKSTLLYTILGLQAVSEGKLYVNGQDSSVFTEKEKSKMDSQFFGIVFQNFNLIYSLDVMDNVILPQVFINIDPELRRQKGGGLLSRFGIESRAKNLPSSLSGGQQQRVAIARSLVNDPAVLLADEPVGNLDSESAKVVMETLSDINRKDKKTVILVTHDPSYLSYADRVYYFKDAKLVRIVKNERKKSPTQAEIGFGGGEEDDLSQLGELEKMARTHSFMTVQQLKAWSLTNYLAEEFTVNQMDRLEKVMEEMLAGRLSEHDFFEKLNQPFSDGGVGLYRTTAIKFTKKISEILREVKSFLADIKHLAKPEDSIRMINMLRKFLLNEYHGQMSQEQIGRMEKAILDRLIGIISIREFLLRLDRPFSQGGVGLNTATAQRLVEKFEIVLAQAYENR